jgi:chromosome segregation ATPase
MGKQTRFIVFVFLYFYSFSTFSQSEKFQDEECNKKLIQQQHDIDKLNEAYNAQYRELDSCRKNRDNNSKEYEKLESQCKQETECKKELEDCKGVELQCKQKMDRISEKYDVCQKALQVLQQELPPDSPTCQGENELESCQQELEQAKAFSEKCGDESTGRGDQEQPICNISGRFRTLLPSMIVYAGTYEMPNFLEPWVEDTKVDVNKNFLYDDQRSHCRGF